MKRYFLLSIGIALMLMPAIPFSAKAQIYGEFEDVVLRMGVSFKYLDELAPSSFTLDGGLFALPPNFTPTNRDDGYFQIGDPTKAPHYQALPFEFEYNGVRYNRIWVNVNGFICFTRNNETPPNVKPDRPDALFFSSSSFPTNVVAPYWGDHYYRTTADRFQGYVPSKISWGWINNPDVPGKRIIIIEWRDFNINDESVQSSVGNFQIWLYESLVEGSYQGDIEFCYGKVGHPQVPDSLGNLVVTRGASIGIKGKTTLANNKADYMNGLEFGQTKDLIRNSERLTVEWPPSLATDNRIRFTSKATLSVEEWWGDGDANLSKAVGEIHAGLQQNRFVTMTDVRVIMRATATHKPLDSVWRREAFHGDVNHNGRYYYDNFGVRRDIPWRDKYFSHNLPPEIDDSLRVFFQVTEYDASMILGYMAARIPSLPWLYDTIPNKGKIGADFESASGITFGTAKMLDKDIYNIPVYINGYLNGPLGIKFDINAEVIEVSGANSDWSNSTVVVSDYGEFDSSEPICYVTFRASNSEINVVNIRFNDNPSEPIAVKLSGIETLDGDGDVLLQNTPNPFSVSTLISLNIREEGYYTLAIYDLLGNRIKTLSSGNMLPGPYSFTWDGSDDSGNKVNGGVYMYRLFGDNVTLMKKLVLSK